MKNCIETRNLIPSYLDNELENMDRIEFEEHINGCKGCRYELEEMKEILQICSELPEEDLPDSFKQQLHEKLLEEKQAEEKRNNAVKLRNNYLKICSSVAAVLLIAFLLRGFMGYLIPGSNIKTGSVPDKSAALSPENPAQKAESEAQAQAEQPKQNAVQNETDMYGIVEDNNKNSDSTANSNDSKQTIKKSEKPAVQEKPSRYEDASAEKKVKDDKVQNDPAPDSPVNSDQKLQSAVTFSRLTSDQNNFAEAGESVDITLESQNPDTELGKIKSSAANYSAFIFPDEAGSDVNTIAAKATQSDMQKSGGSSNTDSSNTNQDILIRVKLENLQYGKFVDFLKISYKTSNIEVGTVNTIDSSARISSLNTRLNEINEKISGSGNQKPVSDPEELNRLKNESIGIKAEIDRLKADSNYTFVTIKIIKK